LDPSGPVLKTGHRKSPGWLKDRENSMFASPYGKNTLDFDTRRVKEEGERANNGKKNG
jgi:hypothetical protein